MKMRYDYCLWILLVLVIGCGPEDETLPVEVENCTNDHGDFWVVGPKGEAIVVPTGQGWRATSQACNELPWNGASGGGQGGDTFHIEPTLEFPIGDTEMYESIEWSVNDMAGNTLLQQGVEVFPEDWQPDSSAGVMRYTSQVFVYGEHRGQNLRLKAKVNGVDGGSVVVAAAVILSRLNE